jgi:hypothetical protein
LIASALDAAVKAVCPIYGVSVGIVSDKATWRIDFRPEATTQQRAAAQAVVTSFDPVSADAPLDISDINNLDKVFRAIGLLIAQYTGKAPATVRNDFMTIYRSLP